MRLGLAAALAGLLTVGVACSSSDDGPGATAPVPTTPRQPGRRHGFNRDHRPRDPFVNPPAQPQIRRSKCRRPQPQPACFLPISGPGTTPCQASTHPAKSWSSLAWSSSSCPRKADPEDPNVVVPTPEDAEIIICLRVRCQPSTAKSSRTLSRWSPAQKCRPPSSTGAPNTAQTYSPLETQPTSTSASWARIDILRPVVLADPRSDTEAFIFDCAISGSHYVNSDGTLADDEVPGTVLAPMIVRLVNEGGVWIVDDVQDDERACT